MLTLIQNIPLAKLSDKPFTVLFKAGLEVRTIETFNDRIAYLSDISQGLAKVEERLEKTFDDHNWMSIGSGFGAVITLSCAVTINPVLFPLAVIAGLSAAGTAGSRVKYSNDYTPIHDQLKRVKALLDERKIEDWAALWEVSGTDDTFLSAVDVAQFHFGKGFTAAITELFKRIAHYKGIDPSLVAEQAKQARSQFTQKAVPVRPAHIPQDAPRYIPAVGEQTRLNAVEVPIVQASEQPLNHPKYGLRSEPDTAYRRLLASPYKSRAMFGAQRTGKSYLAATASLKLSAQGTKIYHLNLASYGDEDAYYWQHATRSIQADLSALPHNEALRAIQDSISLVSEFLNQKDAILIVDEWAYIGSKSNKYADLLDPLLDSIAGEIPILSSTGIKRKKALWTISPEFVAGSLTEAAKAIKKLALCYVTIAPAKSIDWEGSSITFDASLFDQVGNNFSITLPNSLALPNVDRVCFVDDCWLEIGEPPKIEKANVSAIAPRNEIIQQKIEVKKEVYIASEADTSDEHLTNHSEAVAVSDVFKQFADSLTHDSQKDVKSFVLWLSKRKGQDVTLGQIKGWAKNNTLSQGKEFLIPLVTVAKSKKLLSNAASDIWKVTS